VLFLSSRHQCEVLELPVKWEDVEGSHLNVMDASASMLRDMILIRSLYMLGVWRDSDSRW
jgi:dolichyl-phosphate beta-glucosyltransferase